MKLSCNGVWGMYIGAVGLPFFFLFVNVRTVFALLMAIAMEKKIHFVLGHWV